MINILINIVGINKHIVGDDGSLKKKKRYMYLLFTRPVKCIQAIAVCQHKAGTLKTA